MHTATRTCSSIRGCSGTSTRCSNSITGSITTSMSSGAMPRVDRGSPCRGVGMSRNALFRLIAVCGSIVLAAASFSARGADSGKVLHVAFVAPETGFDPQAVSDVYSNFVNREIFDPLYKYDYLARPYKVVPNTAQ